MAANCASSSPRMSFSGVIFTISTGICGITDHVKQSSILKPKRRAGVPESWKETRERTILAQGEGKEGGRRKTKGRDKQRYYNMLDGFSSLLPLTSTALCPIGGMITDPHHRPRPFPESRSVRSTHICGGAWQRAVRYLMDMG